MKTQTQHTPGPWHTPGVIFKPMNYGNARSPQHTPGAYRALGIGNGTSHVGYVSVTKCVSATEARANARLIAAAPELLAALEACLEGVETPTSNHPWAIQRRQAYAKAREAIAKATGGTI